jgi:hypothetical protein
MIRHVCHPARRALQWRLASRRRKDGKIINVSLTVSPVLDDSDRVLGLSNVARAITGAEREAHLYRSPLMLTHEVWVNGGLYASLFTRNAAERPIPEAPVSAGSGNDEAGILFL